MLYKNTVEQIKNLAWHSLSPDELRSVMVLSWYAASEFGSSLRMALALHPESHAFQEMAGGEIQTTNLKFADYAAKADHAQFLFHFIHKHGLFQRIPLEVREAGENYQYQVNRMTCDSRVMSVVSREQELPGVFRAILEGGGWDGSPELDAFRYYLERHIELDSGDDGHAQMLSSFPVNDLVAPFFDHRIQMYRSIPTLFRN